MPQLIMTRVAGQSIAVVRSKRLTEWGFPNAPFISGLELPRQMGEPLSESLFRAEVSAIILQGE